MEKNKMHLINELCQIHWKIPMTASDLSKYLDYSPQQIAFACHYLEEMGKLKSIINNNDKFYHF